MESVDLSESNSLKMRQGEHIILRLTYISRYNNDNLNGEVTRILEQAQQNNERNGITGALVFNHNYFYKVSKGLGRLSMACLESLCKMSVIIPCKS